jgi:hypothetical protein
MKSIDTTKGVTVRVFMVWIWLTFNILCVFDQPHPTHTYIGVIGQYQALKKQFKSNVQPMANMRPNGINELICCFENNVAIIHFVDKTADELVLIQYQIDKNIAFISSGTQGKESVATIVSEYP